MCTHGHIFYGDEIFWSWFWIPKDGECFFLYNVFIIAKFPVNKEELIYWKNPSVPVLFRRIWMLSRLCCCRTVFTLHVFASSMGTSACSNNANASAFHFIYTRLERHSLDHPQAFWSGSRCALTFFDWTSLPPRASGGRSHIAGPQPGPVSPNADGPGSAAALKLWAENSRLWRKRKPDIFKGFFCWVHLRPQCCHFLPFQSLLAMKTDVYSFYGFNHEYQQQNVHFVETIIF